MEESVSLPMIGGSNKIGGIPITSIIGDQIITVLDHILIGSDNGNSLGNGLHARRVKGIVKPIRHFNGLIKGMVGQQE